MNNPTDDEIRTAIAEFSGWNLVSVYEWSEEPNPIRIPKQYHDISALPDYLNDLNAIHEAEKRLDNTQHYAFRSILWEITDSDNFILGSFEHNRNYATATARRRAHALYHVIKPS